MLSAIKLRWTLRQLKSESWGTCRRAIEKLGRDKESRGLEPLIALLGTNGMEHEIPEALDRIDPDWRSSSAAREMVPQLLSQLKTSEREKEWHASLDSIEPNWRESSSARETVRKALLESGEDPTRKKAAAVALGKIRDPRAVEPLIAVIEDEDLGSYAVEALGRIGDPRAVKPLLAVFLNLELCGVAAAALGRIKSGEAVGPLIELLRNREPEVRRRAAMALGDIADSRAVEPLIQRIGDGEHWVKFAALEALGEIGDQRAVKPLMKALSGYLPDERRRAAEALGKIGDSRAFDALKDALKDKDDYTRDKAERALEQIDASWRESAAAEVKALQESKIPESAVKAAEDKNREVRAVAAEALGESGDPRFIAVLLVLLKDDYYGVRKAALDALNALDPNWAESEHARAGVPRLLAGIADTVVDAREKLPAVLGEIGDPRAIETLVLLLMDSNFTVVSESARALEKIDLNWRDTEATKATITKILKLEYLQWPARKDRGGSEGDFYGAARAAGETRDPRCVDPLIETLNSSAGWAHVQASAVEALGKIGGPRAQEAVQASLEHSIDLVRSAARKALSSLKASAG
jgi:HEAT repeat protein